MSDPSPSPSDPVIARVSVALVAVAVAFLCFALESKQPWEGKALSQVAKRLDVAKEEVPWQLFFDFEKLGAYKLGTESYRQIGLWQGAILVGLAVGFCAMTARWWVPLTQRRLRPESPGGIDVTQSGKTFRPGRIGWIGLLLILLIAIGLRVPHLNRVVYFDEQDNLRRNFHGYTEIKPDGSERWREAGWSEALWENKLGNNPVLLSVLAQASQGIWRAVTGADRQRFSIVAIRLPVLLAGLASIAALWWLLQLWGLRSAALIAAMLAAIHPMHINYSLQARGYAFVLLFVPLALGFAWLALRQNRWRDWSAFAMCVFFCLWSYAGSVYFAVAINAGLIGCLLWQRFRSGDPGMIGPISRLLVVNVTTGLLYVFLIFPHIPQVSYHFRQIFEVIPLETFWIFYAWSHYSTGTNFPSSSDIYDLRTDQVGLAEVLLQRYASAEPVLVVLQWMVIPVLIIWGYVWLLRRSREMGDSYKGMILGLGFAAPILALSHQHFTSLYFYYWYLSSALPVVIAGIAIGLQCLIEPLLRRPSSLPRGVAITACVGFFALFYWQSSPRKSGSGRIQQATGWPTNEKRIPAVEFRRGASNWVTTRDGQSIRLMEVFEDEGNRRAGR